MITTTSDGAFSFHLRRHCEHAGCELGDVVIHNETGDRFDISCWTEEDIVDFFDEEHHRESHVEMLERLP